MLPLWTWWESQSRKGHYLSPSKIDCSGRTRMISSFESLVLSKQRLKAHEWKKTITLYQFINGQQLKFYFLRWNTMEDIKPGFWWLWIFFMNHVVRHTRHQDSKHRRDSTLVYVQYAGSSFHVYNIFWPKKHKILQVNCNNECKVSDFVRVKLIGP